MANTDDFLKSISDFTKESGKIAKELFDKGYDIAKLYAEIAKLNVDLTNRKRGINKLYTELGKLYYALRPDEENERIKAVCDKISEEKAAVEKLESAIESIKSEKNSSSEDGDLNDIGDDDLSEAVDSEGCSDSAIVMCEDCGATNTSEDEFCIGCGRLIKKA